MGEGEARPTRRLAFASVFAAFAAWLLAGTGSDARSGSRSSPSPATARSSSCRRMCATFAFEAAGASGGLQGAAGTPGLGARVAATLRVNPSETLLVHVGGQGGTATGASPGRGGWNGGGDGGAPIDRADGRPGRAGSGGGGATDVRRGEGRLRTGSSSPVPGPGEAAAASSAPFGAGGGDGGSPEGSAGLAPLGVADPRAGGARKGR